MDNNETPPRPEIINEADSNTFGKVILGLLLFIVIGCIVYVFVSGYISSGRKNNQTNTQQVEVQQQVDAEQHTNNQQPVSSADAASLIGIELVSFKTDYLCSSGVLYSPIITMVWKNISGYPISQTIEIKVTMINNKTGEDMKVYGDDLLHLKSYPPFLPNTIKKLVYYCDNSFFYETLQDQDISCYIYITVDYGNSIYYKEVKFDASNSK
jgi:hypothetical protein